MHTLFLDAPYTGKVELCKEITPYLKDKKYNTIALYASAQFCNNLETIKKQLQQLNITIFTSHADRTHVKGQLLGCNSNYASLHLPSTDQEKIDAYLYIGDGKFHPLALVYAQKDQTKAEITEIICNDPISKTMYVLDYTSIKAILRKYRASLMKFLSASTIGIIVTVKPGQEHLKAALTIEKKFPDKKFYFFVDDTISFSQLENFPFIDVWVNTACPRIGFDEQEKFKHGIINLNDAFLVQEILSRDSVMNRI